MIYHPNGRQMADRLGVNPKSLRAVIRRHKLVPGHVHGTHYELSPEDCARIAAHPAVRALPRRR